MQFRLLVCRRHWESSCPSCKDLGILGGALVLFGLIGLLFGTETGALVGAVASGLVMAALISAYAWGVFARPAGDVISVT